MWKQFQKRPASWAAVIQAVVALVAVYVPTLPQAAVLALITAVTGLGFAAQRVEDGKTEAALWTDPIDE
jgi:predicted branched-subunit amino acid permease